MPDLKDRVRFMGIAAGLFGVGALLPGCGGGGDTGDGATGNGTSTSTSTSTSTGGKCMENPIFQPLVLGEAYGDGGQDLIRNIVVDETTGELFFSDASELYRLPPGSSTPVKVMNHATPQGDFWLQPSTVQFAGGIPIPLVQNQTVVLSSAPRTGGELTPLVSIVPPATGQWSISALSPTVSGENVYWIDMRGLVKGVTEVPVYTYSVYMSPWTTPGAAQTQLYQSDQSLENLLIAGGNVYINERVAGDTMGKRRQLQLTGVPAPVDTATTALKGQVLAGDTEQIMLSRVDYTTGTMGVFLMRPDGSNEIKIENTLAGSHIVKRGGVWAMEAAATAETLYKLSEFFSYTSDGVRKKIGCVDGEHTTTHATALTQDALYVSIYRHEKSVILRFAL